MALSRRATFTLLTTAAAHAMLHEEAEARRILEDVERNWKPDGVSSFWIAVGRASRGDTDAAFEWLEKGFQERSSFLVYLKETVNFGGLRNDPRFDDLVKRIGIPD
jgi:hypothetical protein